TTDRDGDDEVYRMRSNDGDTLTRLTTNAAADGPADWAPTVGDTTPPAAPTLISVAPASPANNNSPTLTGRAEGAALVRIYTDNACVTGPIASGYAGVLAGGLTVPVADDTTTTFWATATDFSGNTSPCSSTSVTYVEDSTAPAAPTITASPTTPDNSLAPSWSFTGEGGATLACRPTRGATVVSNRSGCTSPHGYDLTGQ